jgi:hypothetical protein
MESRVKDNGSKILIINKRGFIKMEKYQIGTANLKGEKETVIVFCKNIWIYYCC